MESMTFIPFGKGTRANTLNMIKSAEYRMGQATRNAQYYKQKGAPDDEKRYTERADRYAKELRDLRKQLTTLPEDPEITLVCSELEAQLRQHPNYAHDSITLRSDARIVVTLHNLLMRPSENPYMNVNWGRPIVIPLDPITLTIDLHHARIHMSGKAYLDPFYRPEDDDDNWDARVHPHGIDGGTRPCLGEYEQTVVEAIESGDVFTTVTTMAMFLEHANDADSAGQHWPVWAFGGMDDIWVHTKWLGGYRLYKYSTVEQGPNNTIVSGKPMVYCGQGTVEATALELIGKIPDQEWDRWFNDVIVCNDEHDVYLPDNL